MPDKSTIVHEATYRQGYGALRICRHSSPGADYFITICVERPSVVLGYDEVKRRCFTEIQRLEDESHWLVRCATIMPDHLHILATLGSVTDLSSTIRLFKGRLSPLLRKHDSRWQQSFYDHRLRADDDRLPIFLYIFLNPFRKKLIPVNQKWSGYYYSENDWNWFGQLTNKNCPEPAWLSESSRA